jgi:hypothetical protein
MCIRDSTGPIPPELGGLLYPWSIDLSDNRLTGAFPTALCTLPYISRLTLGGNHLEGEIPSCIGDLTSLQSLDLGDNRFTGSIPPEIGNLVGLNELTLQSNVLDGEPPGTLLGLTYLWDGASDFRWNALYTDDPAVDAFLAAKQVGGDWTGTQTVTPSGLAAAPADDRVLVSWNPIEYAVDPGGYEVHVATTSGGSYAYYGTTGDKAATSMSVEGLTPETDYFFIVRTVTEPHADNQNTVASYFGGEVSATTRCEDIFADGFECGSCSAWSGTYP